MLSPSRDRPDPESFLFVIFCIFLFRGRLCEKADMFRFRGYCPYSPGNGRFFHLFSGFVPPALSSIIFRLYLFVCFLPPFLKLFFPQNPPFLTVL